MQALKAKGAKRIEISRRLGLDPRTVNRYWPATDVREVMAGAASSDKLAPYLIHLHQRWNEGHHDAAQLTAEITTLGYTGSSRTVRRYLEPFRHLLTLHTPPAPIPKTKTITGWIVRRPENLDADQQQQLAAARSKCEHLDRLTDHTAAFAKMLIHRTGHQHLEDWLTTVETDDLPELHTFARGIRQDYAAVLNGLTLPHSSGKVEGNVQRLKTLKRQMYGRANLDLLRKRVLLTP